MNISKYQEVSADIWKIFKKYYPEDANLDEFADDVHALDLKYRETNEYKFMQRLMKVFFDELRDLKG